LLSQQIKEKRRLNRIMKGKWKKQEKEETINPSGGHKLLNPLKEK